MVLTLLQAATVLGVMDIRVDLLMKGYKVRFVRTIKRTSWRRKRTLMREHVSEMTETPPHPQNETKERHSLFNAHRSITFRSS